MKLKSFSKAATISHDQLYKLLKAIAVTSLLTIATNGAWAFKPVYQTYGHTQITWEILTDGYSFGNSNLPAFRVQPLYPGQAIGVPIASAINRILIGARVRDAFCPSPENPINLTGCLFDISHICNKNQDAIFILAGKENLPLIGYPGPDPKRYLCVSRDLDDSDAHFDSDNFLGSTRAIYDYTLYAIDLAFNASEGKDVFYNSAASQIMLGKAIHTLQDFYAHSNFSELHMGEEVYFSPITDYLIDSTAIEKVSAQLMESTGENKASTGGSKNGDTCKSVYLGGNHSLQIKDITTAAWSTLSSLSIGTASDTPGSTRCDHGVIYPALVPIDDIVVSGIAKDEPFMPFNPSPHGNGGYLSKGDAFNGSTREFITASYQAAMHKKIYLESVVDYIRKNNKVRWTLDQREKVISTLFGSELKYNQILGFAVDVSGTMKDVLPAIKNSIKLKIAKESLNPLKALGFGYKSFALITFKNPDIGKVYVGTGDEISALVDKLEAKGGTECEVPWPKAVNQLLDAFKAGGSIMLWTDSKSTNDSEANLLTERLAATKLSAGSTVAFQPIVSGSCSPIDPAIIAAAQATGQQAAIVDHSAGGFSIDIAPATSATEGYQYPLLASGTLSVPKVLNIPIDSGVKQLQISVKQSGVTVALKDPTGKVVSASANGNPLLLYSGSQYLVEEPAIGIWQLELSGKGDYEITAEVNSDLILQTPLFRTVLEIGRYGHEYGIDLGATPPSGASKVTVFLNKPQPKASLEFVSLDGNVLGTYPLTAANGAIYQAVVTVPTVPYRMRVSGTDSANQAYARMIPALSSKAPVTLPKGNVVAQVIASQWKLGEKNSFFVNLKNFGATQSVTIQGLLSQQGFVLSCIPSNTVALDTGTEKTVQCTVQLPATTSEENLFLDIITDVGSNRLTIPVGIYRATPTEIPTLSEWVMLILLSILLGLGSWQLRRKSA